MSGGAAGLANTAAVRSPDLAGVAGRVWPRVVAAVVLLAAAGPPELFPGAGLLVLPGLAAAYSVATAARRPLFASYVLGVLHLAVVAWSIRHLFVVLVPVIAVVGGLYSLFAAAATRAGRRFLGPFAFGVAVAAASWLRAEMPEIGYPHGQPCHALWRWPWLLESVHLAGEPVANALLASLAASAVDLWRSWRVAEPRWGSARRNALLAAGLFALACVPLPRATGAPATLDVVAVEPGVHPIDPFVGAASHAERVAIWRHLFRERLVEPTHAVAGEHVADAPDLVLWPESSVPDVADLAAARGGKPDLELPVRLRPGTRLCIGAGVRAAGAAEDTPAAVLFDERGGWVAHQEKQRLVPGGEFTPFLTWLPPAWGKALHDTFARIMGSLPQCAAGRALPPLRTAGGVPFGAMLCYDNAYPGPPARAVRDGALLCVVLSNEVWYRGGGELDQLLAMTVVRARETRTPFVRCTTDGITAVVGADGRILASLPQITAPAPAARTLRFSVPLRTPGERTMALAPSVAGAACAWAAALALLHALIAWARLRAARPASAAGASPEHGVPPGFRGS